MSLFPDPLELDALAERINAHAAATRDRARRLGAAVTADDWQGLAATAFRGEARIAIAALAAAAGRLDVAADALRRHADRVGTLLADLTAVGADGVHLAEDVVRRPDHLLSDGRRLLSDGAGLVGDALHLVGL